MSKKSAFKISTLVVCTVIASYFLSQYLVAQQQSDYVQALELRISEQKLLLFSLAEITKRGGADEVVAEVVVDCTVPERQRFDRLLESLSSSLSATELRELELLYNRCGSFFYDRRVVMTSRMEREIVLLAEFLDLLDTLTTVPDLQHERLGDWQLLVESETTMNQHFGKLVRLQGDIIDALINNPAVDSPEIQAILSEVTDTRNLISVTASQSENLRQQLQTI